MNITLIGMPGAGKTVLGKKLAKRLNYKFLDPDEIIRKKTKLRLQQIIDKFGDDKFLEIEKKTILQLSKLCRCVISPGGSIVYLPEAMKFLKKNSVVVFLDAPFESIEKRLTDLATRGIVGIKNRNLKTIFKERQILYKKYADVTVQIAKDFNQDLVIKDIIHKTFGKRKEKAHLCHWRLKHIQLKS